MSLRRTRLVLLVIAAVAAMAVSSAAGVSTERSIAGHGDGDAALVVDAALAPTSAVRLTDEDRRDTGGSDRSKPRLILVALGAALLVAAGSGRGRSIVFGASRASRVPWWSAHSGRAPPALQLLTA